MTGGYGWVQWGAIGMPPTLAMPGEPVFVPQMGVAPAAGLALLKIVATGLTISSGGSGGVFGPSIFIGGMLGGARRPVPPGDPPARRADRPGGVRAGRHGRVLRRGLEDAR